MRVVTRWPALVPAILRAGHEPVIADDAEPFDNTPKMLGAAGVNEADLPQPEVTARPRGARAR